eukprot:5662326-Prymnesium_polylepis.2
MSQTSWNSLSSGSKSGRLRLTSQRAIALWIASRCFAGSAFIFVCGSLASSSFSVAGANLT